jgi:GNAT superfamily N-acetyltransferase
MSISIECVTASDAEAASHVRQQVFERELRLNLPRLSECNPEGQLTLVARDTATHEPIAALTVVETTGRADLHDRLGLAFIKGERAARYTQLAVLKPYRGINLPVRLILEARRRFVGPRQIHYTWLLFDADRVRTSSFLNVLGFGARGTRILTEYGYSRVLIRDDTSPQAALCDERARRWLQETGHGRLVSAAAIDQHEQRVCHPEAG